MATLESMSWFNNHRLMAPLVPVRTRDCPAELIGRGFHADSYGDADDDPMLCLLRGAL